MEDSVMKNYQKSDYALNKFNSGIVYTFADGTTSILTLERYLSENPGKSESDFLLLKKLSDTDYLEKDRSDYRQTHKNVSIHSLEETTRCAVPSADTEVIDIPERIKSDNQRRALGLKVLNTLTEVQRRRYILRYVNKLTTREIAKKEGVKHQSVIECLAGAEKKIKKFLENA
jgi:hypothetical protein